MSYLKIIDIKGDMPTVDTAIYRLESGISMAMRYKAGAVKVIHGYGSTGAGGKIRRATRKYIAELCENGKISGCIIGEQFSIFNDETRKAFIKCPELRQDEDLDRYNNGVTIVVL